MPASAMTYLVIASLCCNSSHDCRALAKAALICRRKKTSYHTDNNHKFTVEEHGFKEQCQETSVPDGLKFIVGMITRGTSAEKTVTKTQATLCIAQLVFFSTTTKATNDNSIDTPLPVYIGLYVHSRFKSGDMVDELAILGLSVNYRGVMYLEKKVGLSVIQQFTDEGVVSTSGLRRRLFTRSQPSSFNNLCRIFSMAQIYRCFKHILPWTMGRRETCLWFQAVMAKLLFLLNIPLSCR